MINDSFLSLFFLRYRWWNSGGIKKTRPILTSMFVFFFFAIYI